MILLDIIENVAGDPKVSVKDQYRLGQSHLSRVETAVSRPRFWMKGEWTADQADAVRRGYARALVELAIVASDVGDHGSAMDLFERHLECALEDEPERVAALEQLGHEYVAIGNQSQAPGTEEAFREALLVL